MNKQPHILMCPPDFYGIEYEINPWMNRERQTVHHVAVAQWEALYDLLQQAGAKISLQLPIQGLPDLVFTANAAMIYRDTAILASFLHAQRQAEQPYDREWFETHGFSVRTVPEDMYFEGAGDALFCGDTLFAGYRIRSDALGHQQIGEMIGCRVIPVELVDNYYYHIDTCFCPLTQEMAIYYPDAFDDYGRKAMEEAIDCLIPVEKQEAQQFACNAVVVGKTIITNEGCPKLHKELGRHGFQTHATPLGEFVKAGGSAKCLTLRLDGEEAASWKFFDG